MFSFCSLFIHFIRYLLGEYILNRGYYMAARGYRGYYMAARGYRGYYMAARGYRGYYMPARGYRGYYMPARGYRGYYMPARGYRGYYMAARRYEISLRVLKNIEILKYFSTREEKFRISKRSCNVLFII